MCFDHEQAKAMYIRVWSGALSSILAWDKHRIDNWIAKRSKMLDDPDNLLDHEHITYWVACEFIPASLQMPNSGVNLLRLDRRITKALQSSYSPRSENPSWEDIDYDWQMAARAVEEILNEYGESLESLKTSGGT